MVGAHERRYSCISSSESQEQSHQFQSLQRGIPQLMEMLCLNFTVQIAQRDQEIAALVAIVQASKLNVEQPRYKPLHQLILRLQGYDELSVSRSAIIHTSYCLLSMTASA